MHQLRAGSGSVRVSPVTRIARYPHPVVKALPVCTIRAECRWFAQEGRAACERCPQVVTEVHQPSELQTAVALPS
jgi:hypothetical protein